MRITFHVVWILAVIILHEGCSLTIPIKQIRYGSLATNHVSQSKLSIDRSAAFILKGRIDTKKKFGNSDNKNQNRDMRAKLLRDKWQFQKDRFFKIKNSDDKISQRSYESLLALSASTNEWETYDIVFHEMSLSDFEIESGTYASILKECYSTGNGAAALKVLESMQSSSSSVKPDQEHFRLSILALCRNNKTKKGLWKQALRLIHLAAAAIENGEINGDPVRADAYNEIIHCMGEDSRWEDALDLLTLMEEGSGFHALPNLATYDRILESLTSNNQIEVATDQVLSMAESSSIRPTVYSFEIVLSSILRNRGRVDLKRALQLIDKMHECKIAAPTVLYNRIISACAKAKRLEAASDIFYKMKDQNIAPDTVTYNSLISAAANAGRTNAAFRIFDMCRKDTGTDIITYTNTIRACAKSKMSKKAIQLLENAKQNNMQLDAFIYTAAIDACAKANKFQDALNLLVDMEEMNVQPNEYTYSAAITACGNCGEMDSALELLEQMKNNDMKISTITYNAVISALSKAAKKNIKGDTETKTDGQELWKLSLTLLEEMKSNRVWPDLYTYSGVLSCCASGGCHEEALHIIKTMQNGPPRVRPNKIAYTAAISACARSGEYSHALKLFVDMKADRIKCDVVTCNTLLSAFANGGKPDLVLAMWNDMCGKGNGEYITARDNIKPDVVTVTSVIGCLEKFRDQENYEEEIDSIFRDAVQLQILFPKDTMDTQFEIDLSGMSLPIARAAVRYVICKIVEEVKTQDLNLITGIGRSHLNDTALREFVQDILRTDFDPPLKSTLMERAKGVVVVTKETIQDWKIASAVA